MSPKRQLKQAPMNSRTIKFYISLHQLWIKLHLQLESFSQAVAMDVVARRTSSSSVSMLNPNAPLFVPMAYRTVEDFSDQWWNLIQSSPWFREYWLQERFQDPQNDFSFAENEEIVLPDLENIFDDLARQQEEEEFEFSKDLVPMGAFKWHKAQTGAEVPRYAQKAPKIVNVKVSPRTIHQPR